MKKYLLNKQVLRHEAEREQRVRAELLARLVSLPSLEEVTQRERDTLLNLTAKTGFTFVSVLEREVDKGGETWWLGLQNIHNALVPVVRQLWQGEAVPLSTLAVSDRSSATLIVREKKLRIYLRPGVRPVDSDTPPKLVRLVPTPRVQHVFGDESPQDEASLWLYAMLRNGACPVSLCLSCQLRAFVPKRRGQKYCSPACRTTANEANRNVKERREYRRKYMQARRAAGKAPKRPQKKAHTPAVTRRRTATGTAVLSRGRE
jgi:hypothetical protein